MQKPNGFDEAKEYGNFTPVELGGHYAVIKQVSEKTASGDRPMTVVLFDFCEPDPQKNYFSDQFQSDNREDKKWPYAGSMYLMVQDWNDPTKTSKAFKTFCTSYEKSNGVKINWGGNAWAQQFKGKKIGVVFGEVENEYDGKVTMRRNPRWFCSWDSVEIANIPNPKYLNGSSPATPAQQSNQADVNSFVNIVNDLEDEIPF